MSDMAFTEEACLAQDKAPAVPHSRLAIALIELALAVGSFGIGTGEFAIMGNSTSRRPRRDMRSAPMRSGSWSALPSSP
jgi:hypothetical protein